MLPRGTVVLLFQHPQFWTLEQFLSLQTHSLFFSPQNCIHFLKFFASPGPKIQPPKPTYVPTTLPEPRT